MHQQIGPIRSSGSRPGWWPRRANRPRADLEQRGLAALDLAAEHLHGRLEVDDAGDGHLLPGDRRAVQRRGRDRLGAGDREPGGDTAALVHRAGLAQVAGEPGQGLDRS